MMNKKEIEMITEREFILNQFYYEHNDCVKLQQENKELQKENQSLRIRIKTIKRRRKHQTQKKNKYKSIIIDLQNALTEKNNKIDKAIEYINWWVEDNKKMKIGLTIAEVDGLLKILKDSDVDD